MSIWSQSFLYSQKLPSPVLRRCSLRTLSKVQSCQSCSEYLRQCQDSDSSLQSHTFRGTLYELTVKSVLEQSLNCFNMVRVGGAGDNGLDIIGNWDLSRYLEGREDEPNLGDDNTNTPAADESKVNSKSLLSLFKPHCSRTSPVDLSSDVIALVQCKNSRSKIKATTVRELAGIREFHINMKSKVDVRKTFMFLASPLPMTKQAQSQMDMSEVPMIHTKIEPLQRTLTGTVEDYGLSGWSGGELASVYINHSARRLLQGLSVERVLSQLGKEF